MANEASKARHNFPLLAAAVITAVGLTLTLIFFQTLRTKSDEYLDKQFEIAIAGG